MTTGGFDDLNVALRMRDTIARLIREEIDRYRPPEQYGRVIDVNRAGLTAQVVLNGDIEPINVKMSSLIQPLDTDVLNGVGGGCMVLIGGSSGKYWIKQVISGNGYSSGQGASKPKLYGGVDGQTAIATHNSVVALCPAPGSVYHLGRWDNTFSIFLNFQDGKGFIEVNVRQDLFASLYKTYKISLNHNATNGVWQKLAPTEDHGTSNGHDFELEIMADTTGFELRIRRTLDGGGFTPGNYLVSVWSHMEAMFYDNTNMGESVQTAPTSMFATTTPGVDLGPFVGPAKNFNNRVQFNLMGGGLCRMVESTNIFSWTERFVAMGTGRNQYSPGGFYDITQPANGTSIPRYGSSLGASVSATTAGIPLLTEETLYYEVPYGSSTTTSVAGNFRIVARDNAAGIVSVPSHWVMIASRVSALTVSGSCIVGTGQRLNGPIWQTWSPSLQSQTGSPTFGNGTVTARYRRDGVTIHFMFELVVGSTTSFGTDVFFVTLPVTARSVTPHHVGTGFVIDVSAGPARQGAFCELDSTSRILFSGYSGTYYENTIPFTWTTSDVLRASGTYESDGS